MVMGLYWDRLHLSLGKISMQPTPLFIQWSIVMVYMIQLPVIAMGFNSHFKCPCFIKIPRLYQKHGHEPLLEYEVITCQKLHAHTSLGFAIVPKPQRCFIGSWVLYYHNSYQALLLFMENCWQSTSHWVVLVSLCWSIALAAGMIFPGWSHVLYSWYMSMQLLIPDCEICIKSVGDAYLYCL